MMSSSTSAVARLESHGNTETTKNLSPAQLKPSVPTTIANSEPNEERIIFDNFHEQLPVVYTSPDENLVTTYGAATSTKTTTSMNHEQTYTAEDFRDSIRHPTGGLAAWTTPTSAPPPPLGIDVGHDPMVGGDWDRHTTTDTHTINRSAQPMPSASDLPVGGEHPAEETSLLHSFADGRKIDDTDHHHHQDHTEDEDESLNDDSDDDRGDREQRMAAAADVTVATGEGTNDSRPPGEEMSMSVDTNGSSSHAALLHDPSAPAGVGTPGHHHDSIEMRHSHNKRPLLVASPGDRPRKKGVGSNYPPFADMLYKLMAFRVKEKHCRVPTNDYPLGPWVALVRRCYMDRKKGSSSTYLTDERIEILNSIDFTWSLLQCSNDRRWEQNFDQLMKFKEEFGHCNVPQSTALGKWVQMQRDQFRERQLKDEGYKTKRPVIPQERIERLNSIGFSWRVAAPALGWEGRFQELLDYRNIYGHTNVPQGWKENVQLGRWVMKQVGAIDNDVPFFFFFHRKTRSRICKLT